MDIETFRWYCLKKKGVTESLPFGADTLVFKVMHKIFAITGLDDESFKVNLKCDPVRAIELRDKYDEVEPGFHMNKKHWNTVDFCGDLQDAKLKSWIDHSYELVVKGLSKSERATLSQP